jgi:hypothetical protein
MSLLLDRMTYRSASGRAAQLAIDSINDSVKYS